MCLPCAASQLQANDEFAAVGRATAEHCSAAQAAMVRTNQPDQAPPPPQIDDAALAAASAAQHEWEQNRLPGLDWWNDLSWSTALSMGSRTYVQIPDRFRGAVLAARCKALDVLLAAYERGGPTTAEWKFLLLFDSVLLANNDPTETCAELLEERLQWWWGGQWATLWAAAASREAPPPRAGKADSRQKANRVHTLARNGEMSRALASLAAGKPAPRNRETLEKVPACFPLPQQQTNLQNARTLAVAPCEELRKEVENDVCRLLRRPPKLSNPGLLGTRLEHLAHCTDDPHALGMIAKVTAKVAFCELPDDVLQAMRSGEVIGLEKDANDVRPLVVGSTLRRLALRALMRVKKEDITQAAGPHQYGVGRKGGANLLIKSLVAQTEVRPSAVFVKVDLKRAFQTLDRGQAFAEMALAVPDVSGSLACWYAGTSEHLWRDAAGHFEKVVSSRGFDQGCPLAAGAFAVALRKTIDSFSGQLRNIDQCARIYCYLDDMYLVVGSEQAAVAMAGLTRALQPLGLHLNPTKTAVWSPAGLLAVPQSIRSNYAPTLKVLGSYLKTPGDANEAPATIGQNDGALADATDRLSQLWGRLRPLLQSGLKRQATGALLRSYAGPASQHALQLAPASDAEVLAYDAALKGAWEFLADGQLDGTACRRLGLPAKMGGAGVQWAESRRHAAYWCGWTAVVDDIKNDLGFTTLDTMIENLPTTAMHLAASRRGLAQQSAVTSADGDISRHLGSHFRQRLYLAASHKSTHAALLQLMPTANEKASWLSAGGPGSSGFLGYPEDSDCTMEDTYWSTALRQRVGLPRAECSQSEVDLAPLCCTLCGHPLDAHGYHASICQCGGGVMQRHGRMEHAVGGLIKRWTMQQPLYEQRVPSWDRQRSPARPGTDPIERAILDIQFTDGNERRWIDVSIRHPAAGNASELCAASRRAGQAARRGERAKHERYPGSQLTAFVVETCGHLGGEARQWLRQQVSLQPDDLHVAETTRAYKVISAALQSHVARQLRRASGLK